MLSSGKPDLPADGAATYAYKVPARRLHETAQHRLDLDVLSEDGDSTYFDYFVGIKQRGKFWNVRTGPHPQRAVRDRFVCVPDGLGNQGSPCVVSRCGVPETVRDANEAIPDGCAR